MTVYWFLSGTYNSTFSSFERTVNGTYDVVNVLTLTLSKIHDRRELWCYVNYRWPRLPRAMLSLQLTCKLSNLLVHVSLKMLYVMFTHLNGLSTKLTLMLLKTRI